MSSEPFDGTSWILPPWMARFYSDNKHEELDDNPDPITLLPPEGRCFLWGLSKKLVGSNKPSYGIAGQACQMFERYLAANLRKLAQLAPQSSEWQRIKQRLKDKIVLLVAVCIQQATKMNSVHDHINAQSLRSLLSQCNLQYTLEEINEAEAEVFRTIEFRIPLWTNVEKAQMLADEVGMKGIMLETAAMITEVMEHSRVNIQAQIKRIAFETPSTNHGNGGETSYSNRAAVDGNIRSMHLVAGAVAATGLLFQCFGPDPVPRLAFYTHSPIAYIECIRNVILKKVIDQGHSVIVMKRPSESHPGTSKRKRQRHC